MQIVKPGTTVITKIGSISALVTGVCIRDTSITYEISRFAGGKRESDWISRFEFEIDTSIKTKPGFKSFSKDDDLDSQFLLLPEMI